MKEFARKQMGIPRPRMREFLYYNMKSMKKNAGNHV